MLRIALLFALLGSTACSGGVANNADAASGCAAPSTECDGTCTNTDSDNLNCGGCGTVCDPGEVCTSGTCELSCQTGLTECDGTCVDTAVSREHCGGCAGAGGTACSAGDVCDGAGSCALNCQTGLVDCGGTCVDTAVSREHCGGCAGAGGAACLDGEICDGAGACELSCQTSLMDCGGICTDPLTDRTYCGATGACAGSVTCAFDELCVSGTCQGPSGCADGTTEVVWSADVHGCRGPTQTWGEYSEQQTTYCAPGWVLAGSDIVNDELTMTAYTDDVKYAYNGDSCDGHDYFATRHDAYTQTRAGCTWVLSHHWSLGSGGFTGSVEGIVCQKLPGFTDARYTGPAGPDNSAGGWVLCGHTPIEGSLVDPRSSGGVLGCMRRGLRTFLVERSTGICETGDQLGWEYPNDNAEVTLDWQLTNRTNSGWISPSLSGTNTCGIRSFDPWNTTTEITSYAPSLATSETWIYYQR